MPMRLAWITDPHLVFPEIVSEETVNLFWQEIAEADADAFVVTGDLGEANNVVDILNRLQLEATPRPVYFVLGNHDFYGGTIGDVRYRVQGACRASRGAIVHLNRVSVVPLTDKTALVGHDGWGDARVGAWRDANVHINDPVRIGDLIQARALGGRFGLVDRLNELGDEAARHLRHALTEALARYERVIVATHVPPFWDAAWHNGGLSDPDWAPFFVCDAVGRVLLEAADTHPDRDILVLCGHVHSGGVARMRANLEVRTGESAYGAPRILDILEIV